jgi:hypothetical protein
VRDWKVRYQSDSTLLLRRNTRKIFMQYCKIGQTMLVRLTPKSTRFGDDFVGTLAHWMLARLSPLHFGCCHEPVYSPSYVGATACPLIPSNERNALNG